MSRATLIWVSKRNASSRVLSIPRAAIYSLVGGSLFFLLLGLLGLFWARTAVIERGRADVLRTELAEKDELLRQAQAEVQSLETQNEQIVEEFQRVQATENKIRRFLGLNEQTYDLERSHQGGMGPGGDLSQGSPPGVHSQDLPAWSDPVFLETARSLEGSLQEVLAHLEGKREESRKIPMMLPASSEKAWLSCSFGWRKDPFTGNRKEFHNGVDIAGPWKDPIVAPADGVVLQTGKDRLFGVYVKLRHTDRIKTLYGHLASAEVKKGQKVKRGEVIGLMGNTGRSTGTHLHYSVAVDDQYVDPQDYIWDRPFRTLKL